MSFQLVSLRDRFVSRDWTQQELAEFYRVESVLGAAGIAVEMERGVSDEGDPWFIFCRPQNGDVIIHFARYEGTYIAASGALGQVLRGRNFRELVDAFIARQPLVMPGQHEGSSVVLHPSALLTALVATALFLLDHQTADAAPILIDVDLDRAPGHDMAAAEPANKFAALINLLVEPLRPHEQREAMLTIGAIVAGIAALSFDAAKDSPTIAPAIELAADEQTHAAAQIEDDRLAQTAQLPARKMTDGEGNSAIEASTTDDSGAGAATIVITELTKTQAADLSDAMVVTRLAQGETAHKFAGSLAFDGELATLDMPNLIRPLMGHEIEGSSRAREASDAKVAAVQPAPAPPAPEAVTTVHIPAEKAEFLLQDSIAASLTKTIGAGTVVHLSFVDAASVPQLTSGELSKLIAEAGDMKITPVALNGASGTVASYTSPAGDEEAVGTPSTGAKFSAAEQKAMDAISFFAQSNPDFKITQLGKDIILFDFEARPDNKIVYDVHSWSLPDGSKITIIGALPETLSA